MEFGPVNLQWAPAEPGLLPPRLQRRCGGCDDGGGDDGGRIGGKAKAKGNSQVQGPSFVNAVSRRSGRQPHKFEQRSRQIPPSRTNNHGNDESALPTPRRNVASFTFLGFCCIGAFRCEREREGQFKNVSNYCIFSQSISLLAGCRRREHRGGCPCIELRRGRRRFSQSSRGRLG